MWKNVLPLDPVGDIPHLPGCLVPCCVGPLDPHRTPAAPSSPPPAGLYYAGCYTWLHAGQGQLSLPYSMMGRWGEDPLERSSPSMASPPCINITITPSSILCWFHKMINIITLEIKRKTENSFLPFLDKSMTRLNRKIKTENVVISLPYPGLEVMANILHTDVIYTWLILTSLV